MKVRLMLTCLAQVVIPFPPGLVLTLAVIMDDGIIDQFYNN